MRDGGVLGAFVSQSFDLTGVICGVERRDRADGA